VDAAALAGIITAIATTRAASSPENAAIALRTLKLCFAVEWGTHLRSVLHSVELSGRL